MRFGVPGQLLRAGEPCCFLNQDGRRRICAPMVCPVEWCFRCSSFHASSIGFHSRCGAASRDWEIAGVWRRDGRVGRALRARMSYGRRVDLVRSGGLNAGIFPRLGFDDRRIATQQYSSRECPQRRSVRTGFSQPSRTLRSKPARERRCRSGSRIHNSNNSHPQTGVSFPGAAPGPFRHRAGFTR